MSTDLPADFIRANQTDALGVYAITCSRRTGYHCAPDALRRPGQPVFGVQGCTAHTEREDALMMALHDLVPGPVGLRAGTRRAVVRSTNWSAAGLTVLTVSRVKS